MSCWSHANKTLTAAQQNTGAFAHPGVPQVRPTRCSLCNQWLGISGECINPDCSSRIPSLQVIDAFPQPGGKTTWDTAYQVGVRGSTDAVATAYLASLGCGETTVNRALATSPAKVWQYLPRCSTCKCWVSPKSGICKNARCSKGKANATVVATSTWHWPPQSISLVHLQHALKQDARATHQKTLGKLPDAAVAWHARTHDILDRKPQSADLVSIRTYLDEVKLHVARGHGEGWMDPRSLGYDLEAAQALRAGTDEVLNLLSPAHLEAYCAMEGLWTGIDTSKDTMVQMLNPALPPDEADIVQQRSHERLAWIYSDQYPVPSESQIKSFVGHLIDALKYCLSNGDVPAFLPRAWADPRLKEALAPLRNELWTWAAGSGRNEPYVTLTRSRVDPAATWNEEDKNTATLTVEWEHERIDYPPMTRDLAQAAVLNGWSPAELCWYMRNVTRLERDLNQEASKVPRYGHSPSFNVGRILASRARAMTRTPTMNSNGDPAPWITNFAIPEPYNLEEATHMAAGAGASLVYYSGSDAYSWWSVQARRGDVTTPPHWSRAPYMCRTIAHDMRVAGIIPQGATVNLVPDTVDQVEVTNGSTERYRISFTVDGAGEKSAVVPSDQIWATPHLVPSFTKVRK